MNVKEISNLSSASLRKEISNSSDLKWKMIRELVGRTDLESTNLVNELLESEDWTLRRYTMASIYEEGKGTDYLKEIRNKITDKSEYVQREAITILTKMKDDREYDAIEKFLGSSIEASVVCSLSYLKSVWNHKSWSKVKRCYTSSNETISKEAGRVLRQNASEENWLQAFEFFKDSDVVRHRLFALELAEKFNTKLVKEDIQILFRDNDGHIRKFASKLLEGL